MLIRIRAGRLLKLLSVVIPARDEEGCIESTVRHLNLELSLHHVPHEIIVVDDGSTDSTWLKLQALTEQLPALRPLQNAGQHGFGRAITWGLDHIQGDAVVMVMADESDDCHDVVLYWQLLNEGWDAVFGSRFIQGGSVIDYPWLKLRVNRMANLFIRLLFNIKLNDTTNAFKAYRREVIEGCLADSFALLQLNRGIAAEDDCARLQLDGHSYHLAQPADGSSKAENEGNGQSLSVYLLVCLARKVFQPGGLQKEMNVKRASKCEPDNLRVTDQDRASRYFNSGPRL